MGINSISYCKMDIKEYINKKQYVIDNYLKNYFSSPIKPGILYESMTYSLFAGGKRIRPILALSAYEICGGNPEHILPQASAIELIHTYSLIHDDLPAMDNDDLRRGKPTNHKIFGEAVAILAGDALLTEAFKMMTECEIKKIKKSSLLKVIKELSSASGAHGMVGGQAQDIISEKSEPDKNTLEFIHTHKTAALIRASVRTGAILAGSKKSILNALTKYGECIGLAFQIIDDILNIEGSIEELGKSAGTDIEKGKMTYPALYGNEKAKQKSEELVSSGISALKIFSSEADPLREIALYLLKRRA